MMKKIKKIIKKIPGIKKILSLKNYFEYNKDRRLFYKNYMYSLPITKEKLEYDMLFEIHKLEKGFAVINNQRPFGLDKVKRIIRNINEYEKNNFDVSFAYNLAYSSLEEYIKFYEDKNWIDREEYKFVKDYMNKSKKYNYIPVGAFDYKKVDFIDELEKINFDKLLTTRRSVRNFSVKELEKKDIKKAIEMTLKTPTACNRQMCKIYYIKSNDNKKVVEKYAQGLGLFDLTNANYFVITFDISANHFIGERNQGWFNSGLVTMNFVNALHSLGIGSCPIQFGNSFKEEQNFKKLLKIPNCERIGVIITAGYYDEISRIPYSTRKPIEEIYDER